MATGVERLAEAVLILAQQVVELTKVTKVTKQRLEELDTEVELLKSSVVRVERLLDRRRENE